MDGFRQMWNHSLSSSSVMKHHTTTTSSSSRVFGECRVNQPLEKGWQMKYCTRFPQKLATNSQRCGGYVAKTWFGDYILVYIQRSRNVVGTNSSNNNNNTSQITMEIQNDVLFIEIRIWPQQQQPTSYNFIHQHDGDLTLMREFLMEEVLAPHNRILWLGTTNWPGAWSESYNSNYYLPSATTTTTPSSSSSLPGIGINHPDLCDVSMLAWSVPSYAVEDFGESKNRPLSGRSIMGGANSNDILEASIERWKSIKSRSVQQQQQQQQ
jgi:hypothetical protein